MREVARETPGSFEIGPGVAATRPSVAKRHGARHRVSYVNGQHECRAAGKPPVEVRDAPAGAFRRVLLENARTQRGTARADHLRNSAVKVVQANAIHPLERPQDALSSRRAVRRRDADDGTPGDDEDEGEIRESRDSGSRNLAHASSSSPCGVGRDQRNRSNPLVHCVPRSSFPA